MVTNVLSLSNLNDTLILKTGASSLGVGAVCLQYEDSMMKPVANARILTKPLLDNLCQDWLKLTSLFWRGLIMLPNLLDCR